MFGRLFRTTVFTGVGAGALTAAYRYGTPFERQEVVEMVVEDSDSLNPWCASRRRLVTQSGNVYNCGRPFWSRYPQVSFLHQDELEFTPGQTIIVSGFGVNKPNWHLYQTVTTVNAVTSQESSPTETVEATGETTSD